MAGRKMHGMLCRAILGDEYAWIHRIKDAPAKYLKRGHRSLLHNPYANLAIALASKNPLRTFMACTLHDILDGVPWKKRRTSF